MRKNHFVTCDECSLNAKRWYIVMLILLFSLIFFFADHGNAHAAVTVPEWNNWQLSNEIDDCTYFEARYVENSKCFYGNTSEGISITTTNTQATIFQVFRFDTSTTVQLKYWSNSPIFNSGQFTNDDLGSINFGTPQPGTKFCAGLYAESDLDSRTNLFAGDSDDGPYGVVECFYYTNPAGNICQGDGCASYDPANDEIILIAPPDPDMCPADPSVMPSMQEFEGTYNISTSTAWLKGGITESNGTITNNIIGGIRFNIMRQDAASNWLSYYEKFIPLPHVSSPGIWKFDSYLHPAFQRSDGNGNYRYFMEICYTDNLDYYGLECTAVSNVNEYVVDNERWMACMGDMYTTTSTSFWVKTAQAIWNLAFSTKYSSNLLDSTINDATSSIPLSYWWNVRSVILNTSTTSQTFGLILPLPRFNSFMMDRSIDIGSAYQTGISEKIPDGMKHKIWKYAGYIYDIVWIATLLYVLFRIFGIRLHWMEAKNAFLNYKEERSYGWSSDRSNLERKGDRSRIARLHKEDYEII